MKKLTVFVTGASGFIGKNFRQYYGTKYKILAPSHKALDLLDSKAVDRFFSKNKVDVVLHLANKGGSQRDADFADSLSSNLRIFFNLVKNQHQFAKMVYLGSGAEYAKQYPIVKVKETDFGKRIPQDDFGLYKFIAAKYINDSKKIVNLRVFGVYGKYEDWRFKFVSNLICRALYKEPLVVLNNCVFDYIYINDLLRIIDYFISHKCKFNSYNIGASSHQQLATIARKIADIDDIPVPVVVKNKSLGLEYTSNNNRLKSEIKGFQWTNIEDSLTELFLWYKKNLSMINKDDLNPKRKEIWTK